MEIVEDFYNIFFYRVKYCSFRQKCNLRKKYHGKKVSGKKVNRNNIDTMKKSFWEKGLQNVKKK